MEHKILQKDNINKAKKYKTCIIVYRKKNEKKK